MKERDKNMKLSEPDKVAFDYGDYEAMDFWDSRRARSQEFWDKVEEHLEDILATAKLKEVRVYPKDEIMYVRVEVKFLTDMAAWSRPYQMLAAWDCFNNL